MHYLKTIITALAVLLFLSTPALAKMAYVEVQRVLESSEPGQKALDSLAARFEGMRGELEQERDKLEEMRQEMEKQSLVLSQDAQKDLESELRRKVTEFQEKTQNYQLQMQEEERALSAPIIDVLFEVVDDYGEKHEFTMIFDAQSSGIIYADDALNITEEIISKLNKAWEAKEKAEQEEE
ncbi:MAG: OmpH family outer membrane protein [Desulfonatronovibrionaceae bacterium]